MYLQGDFNKGGRHAECAITTQNRCRHVADIAVPKIKGIFHALTYLIYMCHIPHQYVSLVFTF